MSQPTDPTFNSGNDSAFALRNSLKQQQGQLAHERLFERLGQKIFDQGWSDSLLQWWLDELCQHIGAAHGLIMRQHAGALKILAQRGKTFPVGARIPMLGVLGLWLKEPVAFAVHASVVNQLWTLTRSEHDQLLSYQFPIAYQQRAVGLLGLVCSNALTPAQLQLMHSVCGLLALALYAPASGPLNVDDSFLQKLTPREREVFALLPSGPSNAALAEKLGISPGTVKIHIERILSKLGLNDRTQAAVKAVEAGFKSEGL